MDVRYAAYLLVGLLAGMIVREFARSFMATTLGDPTPRLWGRLSLNPKSWFEPFGSGLFPGLILALWAFGATFRPPPFAYAKPAPVDPARWKNPRRDAIVISLAGPIANVAVAVVPGLLLRVGTSGEFRLFLFAFLVSNLTLAVGHLLPIPGLDGARIVGVFLPPRAAEVYRHADQYLPLILLIVFFLLANPLLSVVNDLSNGLCRVLAGSPPC
ncbi:MAG TPA: site-2 protease family protein [Actinomycetota bacterium]|nr:site-2 protease family protein [Actinomycetota bacterium]